MATRSSKRKGQSRIAKAATYGKMVTISFLIPGTAKSISKRIHSNSRLFSVIEKKISAPGVRLNASPRVPLYSADPNPRFVLRRLNGKTMRGRLSGGKFIPKT